MSYNSPMKPPARIEPTGFLTGIQFRPILVGVIVDTIATIALTICYYAFFVAQELPAQGGAEEAYSQYCASSDGLIASLVPVSYTHLRAHETPEHIVCRLL